MLADNYWGEGATTLEWTVSSPPPHHTFAELYMGLARASYKVDLIVEPEPLAGGPRSHAWRETYHYLPRTLIVRARKEGN